MAFDSQSYYWFDVTGAGIVVMSEPKAGGATRKVTAVPWAFTADFVDAPLPPVGQDSLLYLGGLVTDDADEYLCFHGDTQIWRVRKDGSEEVQAVSGKPINALGTLPCNFVPDRLTRTELIACRDGTLYRMPRATGGTASIVSETAMSSVAAFTTDEAHLYVNGTYSTERHLAPILRVSLTGGTIEEVGQMLESLAPDCLLFTGATLVFNSLNLSSDGADLATRSEWAKRQGFYRMPLTGGAPVKISDDLVSYVGGVAADAAYVYSQDGDHSILRISLEGKRETFVDCKGDQDALFREVLADDRYVYVTGKKSYWRYAK